MAKDLTIAFLEYRLLYVNAIFEIIALMKPVQLKDSSVSDAIDTPKTTGAKDSHRDKGICWPKTNWEAEALKNGSRAAKGKENSTETYSVYIKQCNKCLNFNTFYGMCKRHGNSSK